MKTKTCPTCGYPIPSDDVSRVLSRTQLRLYEIVRDAGAAGIAVRDIMDKLYAHDPSAGSIHSNVVSVFAKHANDKIRPFGVQIRARRGPWSLWKIVDVEADKPDPSSPSGHQH